jgi:outer membrane lipoprotein carrier protein
MRNKDLKTQRDYRSKKFLHGTFCILVPFLLSICFLTIQTVSFALDLEDAIAGLQRRYASVDTVTGNFQQTYRAPGIEQVESGVFWLKKPGLMRWEYRRPEEKLFVADGRESFHYVPQDRQVYIQAFSASDLHDTPMEFLLGAADIQKSFTVSWEKEFKRKSEHTYLIRLTPRTYEAEYSFLVLEFDQKTWELQRVLIREASGNTSEFVLTGVTTNVKIENSMFKFKPPKGVEVIRLGDQ